MMNNVWSILKPTKLIIHSRYTMVPRITGNSFVFVKPKYVGEKVFSALFAIYRKMAQI
jgi:hypothetical protein